MGFISWRVAVTATPQQLPFLIYWQNNLMSVSEHALTVSWSTCFVPLLVGHALEPGSTTTSSSLLNIAVWMTQPLSTLRNGYPDPFLCVVFDPAPNLIFASLVHQGNNTETLWSSGIFWWSTKLPVHRETNAQKVLRKIWRLLLRNLDELKWCFWALFSKAKWHCCCNMDIFVLYKLLPSSHFKVTKQPPTKSISIAITYA